MECSITDCTKVAKGRGWCGMHWMRWRKHGDPTFRLREYGSNRRVTTAGYVEVYCPGHPMAMSHGYALEHRKVMHDLGHDVTGMQVHHVDGDRENNNPNNLAMMANGEHQRHHAKSGTSNQYGHHEATAGRICDVDGCDLPVKSRSWCCAHYTRFIRYGDPLTLKRRTSATR